jgi:hypothetical protein
MGDRIMRRILASLTVASLFVLGCSPSPTGPSAVVSPKLSLDCGSTTNNSNNPPATAGGCNTNNNNGNNNNGSNTNADNNPPVTAGN